jgi:hypothetical protein
VTGCCEHGNEPSGSTGSGEFDKLCDCQFRAGGVKLKKIITLPPTEQQKKKRIWQIRVI